MEKGLDASCGGPEVLIGVLPSETDCWGGLLLLGAFNGVEDVLTTGGRGRLELGGLCCDAC